MSAKGEPITRVCNFCMKGMTKARPIPEALVIARGQYFCSTRAPGHCGASADFRLAINLKLSGTADYDMCVECEKELTEIAVRKVLMLDAIEGEIAIKCGEVKASMRDEIQKVMEANFEAMYDATMLIRRARRASPPRPERG
jgi:hypothetical protein